MKKPRATLWFITFLIIASIIIQLPIFKQLNFRKGLDLEGGTSITLRADMNNISSSQRDTALESAKNVIERIINIFGLTEPIIQNANAKYYRIIGEFPGVHLD